jgi:hypothetical protein
VRRYYTFAKDWFVDSLNFPSRSLADAAREKALDRGELGGVA